MKKYSHNIYATKCLRLVFFKMNKIFTLLILTILCKISYSMTSENIVCTREYHNDMFTYIK